MSPVQHYRPDIDGLRAVAVLSVVLFHAGAAISRGGFVGVDVFFVISGYLITGLIVREVEQGSFSLSRFYERRARRILPALYVVLVATLVVGLVMLLPRDLEQLAKAAASVVVFASNVLFYSETGYFGPHSDYQPLLHTWSLAVEEQFYLVFPLAVTALWAKVSGMRARTAWMVGVLLLSLAWCVIDTPNHPEASFYLPFARAWEFLAGGLLAVKALPPLKRAWHRELLAGLGLLALAASILLFSEETPFPGWAALIPCLATCALIHAGTGGTSLVNRVLASAPFVAVGLISYSLYLWHWPLLVFVQYRFGGDAPIWAIGAAIALTFALAFVTWRFVERPFRDRERVNRGALIKSLVGTSAAIPVVCAGVLLGSGLPQRLPANVAALDAAALDYEADRDECSRVQPKGRSWQGFCRLGETTAGPPSFVLWGDSHAETLRPAFDRAARDSGRHGVALLSAGCPVLLGVVREGGKSKSCSRLVSTYLSAVERDPHITTVFLASRWGLYANGSRYGEEAGAAEPIVLSEPGVDGDVSTNPELLRRGMSRLIGRLEAAGKKVVIVGPVPEAGFDVPHALALAELYGSPAPKGPTVEEFMRRQQPFFAVVRALDRRHAVELLWPHDQLCATDRCVVAVRGAPLYVDNNHLSSSGSLQLRAMIRRALDQGSRRAASPRPAARGAPGG